MTDARKDWEITASPTLLAEAYEFGEKAVAEAQAQADSAAEGYCLLRVASLAMNSEDYQRANAYLRQARGVCEHHHHEDFLAETYAGLYFTLDQEARMHRSAGQQELSAALEKEILEIRTLANDQFPRRFHEPLDHSALRVEQGEVGFSAEQPMGTDHICDCICMIVHDPITKKTALAHIDIGTPQTALEAVFKRLPKRGPREEALQVRLVGARVPSHASSLKNIEKVIDALKDRHVDILSADIIDSPKPSTVVVNPEYFTLTEAMPYAPSPDRYIANGSKFFSRLSDYPPLRIAFDTTISLEHAPILLEPHMPTAILRYVAGKADHELREHFSTPDTKISLILPHQPEMSTHVAHAYHLAFAPILAACEQKIAAAEASGIVITDAQKEKVMEGLTRIGIHVGINADRTNQPLLDLIEHEFLAPHNEDITDNIIALRTFRFEKQPLEFLERTSGRSASFQSRIMHQPAATRGISN